MSKEMIDRVAREMFAKLIADDDAYGLAQGDGPENITLDGDFDLRVLARVAIAAMRDLTGNEMIFMKGGDVPPSIGSRSHTTKRIGDLAAKRVWETMIDAALTPDD